MKKVVYSIRKVKGNFDEKISGLGFLNDEGTLFCKCVSKNGKRYTRAFDDVEKNCHPILGKENEFKGYVTMYYYISGYQVGWFEQGAQTAPRWYENEIVITYNFTDSPERLKVNKEQTIQEEKQIERAKSSFSFNSGSTILACSPPTGNACPARIQEAPHRGASCILAVFLCLTEVKNMVSP